jgi:hypothetical protein
VNVTDCPTTEGFNEEVSATLESILFTICGKAADVPAAVNASPL